MQFIMIITPFMIIYDYLWLFMIITPFMIFTPSIITPTMVLQLFCVLCVISCNLNKWQTILFLSSKDGFGIK